MTSTAMSPKTRPVRFKMIISWYGKLRFDAESNGLHVELALEGANPNPDFWPDPMTFTHF